MEYFLLYLGRVFEFIDAGIRDTLCRIDLCSSVSYGRDDDLSLSSCSDWYCAMLVEFVVCAMDGFESLTELCWDACILSLFQLKFDAMAQITITTPSSVVHKEFLSMC